MQYMLNILYDPKLPPDGVPSRQKLHQALTEHIRAAGHYLGGAGLAPVDRYVKRVRQQDGEAVVTDGPFAETREALGGYFMVDCSEAEALAYAARIPVDPRSWIEVRMMWADPTTMANAGRA